MRCHALYLYQDGVTTLSSSGFLFPREIHGHMQSAWEHDGDIIITCASLVEPFLVAEQRNNPTQELKPVLIPDTQIDVYVEGKTDGANTNQAPHWITAQLLSLGHAAVQLRIPHGILAGLWPVPRINSSLRPEESIDPASPVRSSTRIAILGIDTLEYKRSSELKVSRHQQQGDFLLITGSPFGALAPQHFYNSVSIGAVANCLPPSSSEVSLLLADVRCFPGMEGGLVLNRHASLVGMLIAPLRQKGTDTEIQVFILQLPLGSYQMYFQYQAHSMPLRQGWLKPKIVAAYQ